MKMGSDSHRTPPANCPRLKSMRLDRHHREQSPAESVPPTPAVQPLTCASPPLIANSPRTLSPTALAPHYTTRPLSLAAVLPYAPRVTSRWSLLSSPNRPLPA